VAYVEKAKTSLKEFIDQYLEDYAKPNLRAGTVKNNESILTQLRQIYNKKSWFRLFL